MDVQTQPNRWPAFAILALTCLVAFSFGALRQYGHVATILREGAGVFPGLDEFSLNAIKFWLSVAAPTSLALAVLATLASWRAGQIAAWCALLAFAAWWLAASWDNLRGDLRHAPAMEPAMQYVADALRLAMPNLLLLVGAVLAFRRRPLSDTALTMLIGLGGVATIGFVATAAPLYFHSRSPIPVGGALMAIVAAPVVLLAAFAHMKAREAPGTQR